MDEKQYLTKTIEEKPAPNSRQWVHLMHEVDNRLFYFARDQERDPAEDVVSDSLLTFAATLPSHMGYEITTRWNDRLAKISVARESGRQFAEQFEDDELINPSGHIALTPEHLRKAVVAAASGAGQGTNNPRYPYYSAGIHYNFGAVNPEVLEKATAHGEQFSRLYISPSMKDQPLPGEQRLWNLAKKYYDGRKKAVREAYGHFSTAMHSIKSEISKKDRLFSSKLNHWIERDGARADFERIRKPLTKPLDDYAWSPEYYGGYRRNGYQHGRKYRREYSHKVAQAAYNALKRSEQEQEYIDGVDAIMGDPLAVSIENAIQNAEVWGAAYLAALEKAQKEQRIANAKRVAATRVQEELVATPVKVQAIERDGAFLIDQKALKKGLVKRRGYITVKGVAIPITKLRQWLTVAIQDPATGRAITAKNYGRENWIAVQAVESVKRIRPNNREEGPALIFTLPQQGTLKAQSTFLGLETEYQGGDVHAVKFDIVEEEKITVWTPDLINRLKPVLAVPA